MDYFKFLVTFTIFSISQHVLAQNTVPISLQNIKGNSGTMQIAVYDKTESFPKVGGTFRLIQFKIADGLSNYSIKDLPNGEYAIAIHHDENSDGKMNTNMLGIPKEGYAFSKNFKPKFSAPKFSDCAIQVNGDKKLTIEMIY